MGISVEGIKNLKQSMDITQEEYDVLALKISAPNEEVLCPRCGKPLLINWRINSGTVWCPTSGCIVDKVRGL